MPRPPNSETLLIMKAIGTYANPISSKISGGGKRYGEHLIGLPSGSLCRSERPVLLFLWLPELAG